jgi:hypothetical protein
MLKFAPRPSANKHHLLYFPLAAAHQAAAYFSTPVAHHDQDKADIVGNFTVKIA